MITPDNPLIKFYRWLPWQWQIVFALGTSLACCVAIWWFATHGWPNLPFHYLAKLQVYLFMAAPCAVLFAILSFFIRNNPDDKEQ